MEVIISKSSMQYTAGDILRAAEGDMAPMLVLKKIIVIVIELIIVVYCHFG